MHDPPFLAVPNCAAGVSMQTMAAKPLDRCDVAHCEWGGRNTDRGDEVRGGLRVSKIGVVQNLPKSCDTARECAGL
jgi:hypothetical protein